MLINHFLHSNQYNFNHLIIAQLWSFNQIKQWLYFVICCSINKIKGNQMGCQFSATQVNKPKSLFSQNSVHQIVQASTHLQANHLSNVDGNIADTNAIELSIQKQNKIFPKIKPSAATQEIKIERSNDQSFLFIIQKLTSIILKQPAFTTLINKQYILAFFKQFEKGYVSKQAAVSIIELVLVILKDSIKFVNEGRKCISYSITEQFRQSAYVKKLAAKWNKLKLQIFFTNKDALKTLNYFCSTGKDKTNKDCFQHLQFDYSDEQVKKVANDVKKLCKYDMRSFAFLSNYLLKCCYHMGQSKIQQINGKLKDVIKMLRKEHPPAPAIQIPPELLKEHQNFEDNQKNIPKPSIDLKNIVKENRVKTLQNFIEERVKQSHLNYPIFVDLIKQTCISNEGYHFKTGLKLKSMTNQKAIDRIKQKMLDKQFQKSKINENQQRNIDDYVAEEYNHYLRQMQEMYERIADPISFQVSDMVRGKCMFHTIQKINDCATALKQKIKQKQKGGCNIRLVEVDNRLAQKTCDLVYKILINESICELQLTVDSVNVVQNEFNHKIFEIARSKFFSPLSTLMLFNDQISKDYFSQMQQIISSNIQAKQKQNYEQNTTFQQINSQKQSFFKMLPKSIKLQVSNNVEKQKLSKLSEQIQNIEQMYIKNQNINDRMLDIPFRNGNFKYELKEYDQAEQQLDIYCKKIKAQFPDLFDKIKNQKFNQITNQQKQIAEQYSQASHILGLINYQKGNYQKALQLYEQKCQLLREQVLDDLKNYAITLNVMGLIYDKQANYQRALLTYKQCLQIQNKLDGIDKATTLNNIGIVYVNQRKYNEALPYFQACLKIQQTSKGKGCFQSSGTLNNIGKLHTNLGNFSKALQFYERSLQIKQKQNGKQNVDTALSLNNIGYVYKSQRNLQKALQYYKRCLQILQKVKGKNSIDVSNSLNNIAEVYEASGDIIKAIQYYKRSIQIEQVNNVKYEIYAVHNCNLGRILMFKTQDYAATIPCFLKAEPILKNLPHQKHTYLFLLKYILVCYEQLQNIEKISEYQQKIKNVQT